MSSCMTTPITRARSAEAIVLDLAAVDEHLAAVRLEQADHQMEQRRLAASRRPGDRDRLARLDRQARASQDPRAVVAVAEPDVLDLDADAGAVGDDERPLLRRIGRAGLVGHHVLDPLGVGAHAAQLHRVEHGAVEALDQEGAEQEEHHHRAERDPVAEHEPGAERDQGDVAEAVASAARPASRTSPAGRRRGRGWSARRTCCARR